MNLAILWSILRTAGPPVLTYLAGRYPEYAGVLGTLSSFLVTGGATIWGAVSHTEAAQLKVVEAMPDVGKILPAAGANPDSAVVQAAEDPSRPKVVLRLVA